MATSILQRTNETDERHRFTVEEYLALAGLHSVFRQAFLALENLYRRLLGIAPTLNPTKLLRY